MRIQCVFLVYYSRSHKLAIAHRYRSMLDCSEVDEMVYGPEMLSILGAILNDFRNSTVLWYYPRNRRLFSSISS